MNFTFVHLPADSSKPIDDITAHSLSSLPEKFGDAIPKLLKQGKEQYTIDITPLRRVSDDTSTSVMLYILSDSSSSSSSNPSPPVLNRRASSLIFACGVQDSLPRGVYGEAYVGRVGIGEGQEDGAITNLSFTSSVDLSFEIRPDLASSKGLSSDSWVYDAAGVNYSYRQQLKVLSELMNQKAKFDDSGVSAMPSPSSSSSSSSSSSTPSSSSSPPPPPPQKLNFCLNCRESGDALKLCADCAGCYFCDKCSKNIGNHATVCEVWKRVTSKRRGERASLVTEKIREAPCDIC